MSQVAAVVQVQSLAWELMHALGKAKKKKKNRDNMASLCSIMWNPTACTVSVVSLIINREGGGL